MCSLNVFFYFQSTALLIVTAIILILTYYYIEIKKIQKYWENKGVKYVKPNLMGNVSIYPFKSVVTYITELYNHFPEERYYGFFIFNKPALVIKDPDLIKQIGVKEFESFMDHRSLIPPEIDPLWNKNLFASIGQEWRDMRTTLSPSFTASKLKNLFPLMEECTQQFVDYFKNHECEIKELEVKEMFTRYTNDVIATAAFGINCDSIKDKTNEFYLMGKKATDFGGLRSLRFFLAMISPFLCKIFNIKMIDTDVGNYFTGIIKKTVRIREEQNIKRPDMISVLMEARKQRSKIEPEKFDDPDGISVKIGKKREITIDDIAAQAFAFFLAGFETTSTFLSFTFYELAVNPEIQSKLRDEILIFKEKCDEKITYETIQAMKYLDMVLSESLRKWPPGIMTDRVVTKPFTIEPVNPGEKALDLEVGTPCWLLQTPLQHDSRYYPEPDKFDPERFNEENKLNRHPSTYIPFGIGPRICLGSRFVLLEVKLLVYYILQNFEIVPVKKTHNPMVLEKQFVLAPKGGMWLGFKKI